MRLSYRGVHYHHQPTPVDLVDSGTLGQYRGQQVNFSYPRHIPVPQPVIRMKYRGAEYCTTPTGGTQSIPHPHLHPEMALGEQGVFVPLPLASKVRRVESPDLNNTHLENIRKRLQHRIEVARAKGDKALLSQLEQENRLLV